jgi:hypothetical protein
VFAGTSVEQCPQTKVVFSARRDRACPPSIVLVMRPIRG